MRWPPLCISEVQSDRNGVRMRPEAHKIVSFCFNFSEYTVARASAQRVNAMRLHFRGRLDWPQRTLSHGVDHRPRDLTFVSVHATYCKAADVSARHGRRNGFGEGALVAEWGARG